MTKLIHKVLIVFECLWYHSCITEVSANIPHPTWPFLGRPFPGIIPPGAMCWTRATGRSLGKSWKDPLPSGNLIHNSRRMVISIVDLAIKDGDFMGFSMIFHSYVSLPQGIHVVTHHLPLGGRICAKTWQRPEDVPPPAAARPRTERLGRGSRIKWGSQWMRAPLTTAYVPSYINQMNIMINIYIYIYEHIWTIYWSNGDPNGSWHLASFQTRPVSSAGLRVLARLRREAGWSGGWSCKLSHIFPGTSRFCTLKAVWSVVWDFEGCWSQQV